MLIYYFLYIIIVIINILLNIIKFDEKIRYIYISIYYLLNDLISEKSITMIFLDKILKNNNNKNNMLVYYFLFITMIII